MKEKTKRRKLQKENRKVEKIAHLIFYYYNLYVIQTFID
jgi:hypothetical protein